MTYNEKKSLYENIMKDVSKIVKKQLNETSVGARMHAHSKNDNDLLSIETDIKNYLDSSEIDKCIEDINKNQSKFSIRKEIADFDFGRFYCIYISVDSKYVYAIEVLEYLLECLLTILKNKYAFEIGEIATVDGNGKRFSTLYTPPTSSHIDYMIEHLRNFIKELEKEAYGGFNKFEYFIDYLCRNMNIIVNQ